MTDNVSRAQRSKMMAAVRGKNTGPERMVRSELFAAGFRYRLHKRGLPGTPDIVLTRFRTAVFVHGCFWHGHKCRGGRRPKSNVGFWNSKLGANALRDKHNQAELRLSGWRVVVIWECRIDAGCRRLIRQLSEQLHARHLEGTSELTR